MRGAGRSVIAGLLLAASLAGQEPGSHAFQLRLNIPAYRLDVLDSGRLVMSAPVAVGMRRYQTPTGTFAVRLITWNPWWFPPPSPWAANDTVTPPCPANPVGKVKLGFAPRYFIHGTPRPGSLGHAASHGCVRAGQDDVLAIAALLIQRVMPESAAAAARHAAGTETRAMRLANPVPLVIRYDLAEVRGDSLWMYPDPYRKAATAEERLRHAVAALAAAGRVRPGLGELRRLSRDGLRRPAALPLPPARE